MTPIFADWARSANRGSILFRGNQHRPDPVRVAREFVDAPLHLAAEVAHQALDRPGRRIAQRADRVTLDLLGDVEQHVDLALLSLAAHQPLHDAPHPARALAAGRALAAAL